jgi:hypothetical protein
MKTKTAEQQQQPPKIATVSLEAGGVASSGGV